MSYTCIHKNRCVTRANLIIAPHFTHHMTSYTDNLGELGDLMPQFTRTHERTRTSRNRTKRNSCKAKRPWASKSLSGQSVASENFSVGHQGSSMTRLYLTVLDIHIMIISICEISIRYRIFVTRSHSQRLCRPLLEIDRTMCREIENKNSTKIVLRRFVS